MNDANARTEESSIPAHPEISPDLTRSWHEDEEETLVVEFEDFTDRMLGEFRLLRLLGRGGMADVYLADQTSLNRKVALKILRPELKANGVFLKRFEREARAAASLSHPNIVQVFLVGEADELHFIAQEYVKGLNLREYIRRKGPPNAQLGMHFMKQVLLALDRAAGAGIVHRDIKPENILITNKGMVKVADFGLAQLSTPQSTDKSALELTQVGTTMGTPLYMSPEQVHGAKLDQRSDLYSFGVTSFHMLAGEPPFQGESAMSVAIQHLNKKPPRLKDRRPDLPPALCQIVHKLMAKDVEKRYQSASAVLRDLKQIQTALKQDIDPASLNLSGFDLELDEEELGSSWFRKIAGWSQARKITVYTVVCLLLAGFAGGLGWALKPNNPLKQPVATQTKIETKSTIAEQYQLALQNQKSEQSFADYEEAWKAVINHPEQNKEYRYKALEQLGAYYVGKLKLDRAKEVFNEMVALEGSPLENVYRLKGLTGQAVIANLEGNNDEAWKLLNQSNWQSNLDNTSPLRSLADELDQRLAPSYLYNTD